MDVLEQIFKKQESGIINDKDSVIDRETSIDTSSQWLNHIFENKVAGIFILNEKGQFLRTNETYQTLSGYTADELKDLTVIDLTPNEDWDVCSEKMGQLISGELDTFNFEKRLITKSGRSIWVTVSCTAVRQEKTYALCFLNNINEKKLVQENLIQSERQLQQAQEIAKIGSWAIDLQTQEISWSKGMYDLMEAPYDYQPDRESALGFIHPEDRELFIKEMDGTKELGDLEIRHVNSSGVKHILINSRVEYDEHGVPVRYHGTSQDISERRFIEKRHQLVQNTAKLGWWESNLLNDEDDIWSDYVYELLGLDRETTKPCFESFLDTVHPDDKVMILNSINDPECLKNGWHNKVTRVLKADGTYRYLLDSGYFVWDGDRPVRLIGTMMDISETKEMQLRLEEVQEIARLGWWETDLRAHENTWSSAIYDIMEVDPSEGPLSFEEYAERIHPEDRPWIYKDPRTIKDGWKNVQLRYKKKSGGYTHTLGSGRVIFDGDVPVKMIGTNMDITSLVETQLKLEEAEKTATQSQELLESINQNISEGIYRSDINGLIYVNNAFVKMFGYDSAEEMFGLKSPRLYKNPEDRNRLVLLLHENLHYENEEIIFIKKDGTEFTALSSCTANKDASGRLFWDGAIRDVTSLVETQRKLEEAQKIARLGWWEFDLTGQGNNWYSPEHMEIFGIKDADEIKTFEDYLDFIHPDDKQAIIDVITKAHEGEGWNNLVSRVKDKNGGYKYITVNATVEFIDNKPARLFGSVYDITDLKVIELKLAKNLVNMEAMVNSMEDIVFVIDDQLVFREVFCNDPGKLPIEAHEFIGKKVELIWADDGTKTGPTFETCKLALEEKIETPVVYKYLIGRKKSWWEAHFKPFIDQDGKKWLTVIIRDITTRKNAEEELIKTVQKERELSEMSAQFVSMASHQFRTPLTVIKSNMQLLELSEYKDPVIEKVTKRLNGEVDRLVSLMEDIMAMGKVQSNSMEPDLKPVDLPSLIGKIKGEVERQQTDGRHLDIEITGKVHLVNLDERFIEHALHNLIDNAFKYSPDTSNPQIRVNYKIDGLHISIIDYGIGIPKEDRSRLFNSFQRGSNSQHIKGTGLGLAVAKEFIRLNKGTLYLNNESKSGTEFCIDLMI